jgi:hypothetical protein
MRAAALFLVTFACDGESLSRVRAELEVPAAVDFGDVQVGIEKTIAVEIKNTGGLRAVIDSVEPESGTFSSDGYEFRVIREGFTVQPSGTHVLELHFRPYVASDTAYRSKISLATDDGAIEIHLSGRGVRSGLVAVPDPVDFGPVLIGSTKRLDVVITNVLSEKVRVTTREADVGRFHVDVEVAADGLIAELEPNASITVPIEFTPLVTDPERERWFLSNCESDVCETSVVLQGRGSSFAIACTPEAIDFGTVHPGATRTMMTSCRNVTGDEVTIDRVTMAPGSASEYRLMMPPVPAAMGIDAVLDIAVDYTPTQATYDTGITSEGSIQIAATDPGSRPLAPVFVPLTGRAGGSSIDVLPRVLDFGTIALGTNHTKRVLVINNGFDDLVVEMVNADVAGTGAFATDTMALAVPPRESAVLEVTFTPSSEGAIGSSLVMSTNDAANPMVEVMLLGTGVDLPPCSYQIVPAMLSFGVVRVGEAPEQSVAIQNVGGNDCLLNDIDFVEPFLGTSNPFSLINGAETGLVLAPGQTHDVPVRYMPISGNTDRAIIGFYVNTPGSSNPEVPVFGVGESVLTIQCPAAVTTAVGTPVTLAATAQVLGGNITGYRWSIGSAPTGGIGTPDQWDPDPPDQPTESFLPFIVGTYDIMAEVFDDQGRSTACTTQVIAQGEGLVVTLTWDGSGDVDLHVHNQNPTPWFGSTDDCYYANQNPVWIPGQPASQGPNPALDFDNTIANGPENTRVSTVMIGQPYTVAVHNYDAAAGRVATVTIFCGGVTAPTFTATSNPLQGSAGGDCTNNDFWRVATVTFTSASQCTVTPIDTYTTSNQACSAF